MMRKDDKIITETASENALGQSRRKMTRAHVVCTPLHSYIIPQMPETMQPQDCTKIKNNMIRRTSTKGTIFAILLLIAAQVLSRNSVDATIRSIHSIPRVYIIPRIQSINSFPSSGSNGSTQVEPTCYATQDQCELEQHCMMNCSLCNAESPSTYECGLSLTGFIVIIVVSAVLLISVLCSVCPRCPLARTVKRRREIRAMNQNTLMNKLTNPYRQQQYYGNPPGSMPIFKQQLTVYHIMPPQPLSDDHTWTPPPPPQ